jgi:hypothetical protein
MLLLLLLVTLLLLLLRHLAFVFSLNLYLINEPKQDGIIEHIYLN